MLIPTQKLYFGDNDAIYDVIIQEPVEYDVINTDMKSAGIYLLNYYYFRHTQQFSFWDKWTRPILPFVVLPLCKNDKRAFSFIRYIDMAHQKYGKNST